MQQRNDHTDSPKIWRYPLLLAIAATVVLFVSQLYVDFKLYQQQQQQKLASQLELLEPAVRHAVTLNDSELSRQLVSQFLEQPAIAQVSINSSQQQLASAENTTFKTASGFPSRLFMPAISEHKKVLVSATTGRVGSLTFAVNNHQLYRDFYLQALLQLSLFLSIILALLISIRHLAKTRIEKPWQSIKSSLQLCQQQLHRNQQALEKINQITPFGSWLHQQDGFQWSGQLADLLSIEANALTDTQVIINCVGNSHREQLLQTISKLCDSDELLDMKLPLKRTGSRAVWVRAIGSCQRVNGNPLWAEGVLQDITDSHQSEQNLQLCDFVLNQSPDSIFTLDTRGRILSVNDTACRVFGYSRAELVGESVEILSQIFCIEEWPRWWKTVKRQGQHTSFTSNQTKSGKEFPSEVVASIFARDGQDLCILSIKDITERKKQEKVIQHLAYHDSLTNLPNRRLLLDRLQQALVSAKRHAQVGAVLFIDLDNFKKINDSQGHSAGDQVLKTLASRITQHLRADDTVARIGGDEFVVLLPVLNSDAEVARLRAEDLANKLLNLITRPIQTDKHPLQITASIGVVNFPGNNDIDAEKFISFADTAMYKAKQNGRNGVVYFQMSMADDISRKINLESRLRSALENDELFLHFQPQYRGLQQLVGAEVLLRWDAPSFGLVSPAEFVPIMESSGLIVEIGEWVMRQACRQIRSWIDMGLWSDNLTLGVNISPVEFEQLNFVDQVARILLETGVPPQYLDIEITEGTVITNIDQIIETLGALRDLGVKISIDDFGTGYSSLTYLKCLPIDMVKIDQSFVRDIPGDDSAGAIISTIIAMAEHLNLDIIAEGIESIEQIHFLQQHGCQKFQGFFFHTPMAEDKFTPLLADNQYHLPLTS